jgi:polyhydroxyalkanoate synthase
MHSLKTKISTHQNKLKNLSTRIFNGKSLILSQSTPYEVIETFDLTQIRYYAPEVRKYKEPLVFVVPLAINMSIYDLYPYRSLVKYFQQQGFAVYVIDWGKLNIHNRHFNFLTFIDHYIPLCIQSILKHSDSEQISLHGWSMAGIFVTLYTALHQPNFVKNLMVLGVQLTVINLGEMDSSLHISIESFQKAKQYNSKFIRAKYQSVCFIPLEG